MAPFRSQERLAQHRNSRVVDHPADYREPAERDRDRILYSSAFRRLGGVTQVVAVNETQLFHNRLTHSIKVAQIARRLAERLVSVTDASLLIKAGGLDPAVTEAGALAHDLGHPPFGHIAEEQLQECVEDRAIESFEGNAQSFRVVNKLAFRSVDPGSPALNLTRATLNAVLKYPWMHDEHPDEKLKKKWGAYRTERDEFGFARDRTADEDRPSLEAQLMDWADDIAYAVHDVEDFFRAGLIPLHHLARDDSEAEIFKKAAWAELDGKRYYDLRYAEEKCKTAVDQLRRLFPAFPYGATRVERAAMHALASTLISRYVEAVSIDRRGRLAFNEARWHEVGVLKQLTVHYVIHSPALVSLQRGQRGLIRELFERLEQWAGDAEKSPAVMRSLPTQFREILLALHVDKQAMRLYGASETKLRARAVVDYVAILTEAQAYDLYRRLTGHSVGSALDPWLRV